MRAYVRAARRRGVVRVCMVSTFSRVWINRGKNPSRRQLNKEKCIFPFPRLRLRFWSSETGSAIPSYASLLIHHTQAKSLSYSRISPISATALTFAANRHWVLVPNLSSHAIAYRSRSLPRTHWHSASSPQDSFKNAWCLFRFLLGPSFCWPLFFHTPHYWYAVQCSVYM